METSNKIFGFINISSKTSTIVWATIIVGILDALAAIIVYGIFYRYYPIQVYQFVSSAILGTAAYSGGIPVALLGLFFHFLIAFVCSYLFIQLYSGISMLRENKIIIGLIYGFVIWAVMNLLIIPFSKIPPSNFDVVSVITIAWHMLLVGLPISLLANQFYANTKK